MLFIIVNKEFLSLHGGYEAEVKDDRNENRCLVYCEPICTHLPLPENLDPACVKAVLIDEVITLVEDPDKVAAKSQAAKDALVAAARASFDADVDAQMFIVYGTRDRTTASVINQSWSDMLLSPETYVPEIFPSVEALQTYVTPLVSSSRLFNIWRIKRLVQRDSEIAGILA